MAVRINGNSLTSSSFQSKARANVSIETMGSDVFIQIPISKIGYIELTVIADLDSAGRYRFVMDSLTLLDGTVFSLTKNSIDTLIANDHSSMVFDSHKADAASFEEYVTKFAVKELTETYGLSDIYALEFAKSATSALSATDTQYSHLYKTLYDAFGLNDSFDTTDGLLYSVFKSIINVILINETHQFSIDKSVNDVFITLELVAVNSEKYLLDQTEQNEVVLLNPEKNLFNSQQLTDSILRQFDKVLNDLQTVSDSLLLNVSQLRNDSFNAVDAYALHPATLYNDSLTLVSDVPIVSAHKVSNESLVLSDFTLFSNEKLTIETVNTEAAISKLFVTQKQDSVGFVDFVTKELVFLRDLSDAFAVDDFTGIGDGLNVQSFKTIGNVAFLNDVSNKSLELSKTEVLLTSDIGFLVSQGYCDLTYFADNYVGSTRSF